MIRYSKKSNIHISELGIDKSLLAIFISNNLHLLKFGKNIIMSDGLGVIIKKQEHIEVQAVVKNAKYRSNSLMNQIVSKFPLYHNANKKKSKQLRDGLRIVK